MTTVEEVRASECATITVKDAAAFLGVDQRTLSGALTVHRGDIPSLSIGRRIVIPRAAFLRWYDGGAAAESTNAVDPGGPAPVDAAALVRAKVIELLAALEEV